MPTGKQAELTLPPAKLPPPRAPFGPSETLMAGMPKRSTGVLSHMLSPASSDTFSATVSWPSSASMRASELVRSASIMIDTPFIFREVCANPALVDTFLPVGQKSIHKKRKVPCCRRLIKPPGNIFRKEIHLFRLGQRLRADSLAQLHHLCIAPIVGGPRRQPCAIWVA